MTPAMAAGITDRVWTTPELLSYRDPDVLLDKLQGFDPLFQSIKDTHQGSGGTLPDFKSVMQTAMPVPMPLASATGSPSEGAGMRFRPWAQRFQAMREIANGGRQ